MTWPTVNVDAAYDGLIGTVSVSSMTWTAIHNNVRAIRIDTPRKDRLLDRVTPGRMSIVVDSQAREFDPFDGGGIHSSLGVSQIRPGLPLRVTASVTSPPLSNNFAVMFTSSIDQQYDDPRAATTTFHAQDGFAYLARASVPVGTSRPEETTSARVAALLDLGVWPSADRVLDTAATMLRAESDLGGQNVLALVQSAAEHEHGDCYVDSLGRVAFRRRGRRWESASLYTFSDVAGATYWYESIDVRHDLDVMVNKAQMQNADDATIYEYEDTLSSERYGAVTFSKLDWRYAVETEVESWTSGVVVLYSSMVDRIVAIVLNPAVADALWTPVFQLVPGSVITVTKTPPQQASGTVTRRCFVEGLSHDIVPASGSTQGTWLTTLWLSDAEAFGPDWTIGDPPVWDGTSAESKWDTASWFY